MQHNWTNKLLHTNKDHDLHHPKPSTLTNTCQHSLWIRGPTKVAWILETMDQNLGAKLHPPGHKHVFHNHRILRRNSATPNSRSKARLQPLTPSNERSNAEEHQPQPQGEWCTLLTYNVQQVWKLMIYQLSPIRMQVRKDLFVGFAVAYRQNLNLGSTFQDVSNVWWAE